MSDPVAAPAAPSPAESIFQQLADALGADALGKLKAVLGTTATNVENNPTVTNAGVQFGLLLPAFIGVAPALETDAIKSSAQTINKLLALIPDPAPPTS